MVAYDDEKLEELWRFNVGTPLKGAPVTYAIGPKQYLAVQSSGRHVHPVKYDKLENSSYMFVFSAQFEHRGERRLDAAAQKNARPRQGLACMLGRVTKRTACRASWQALNEMFGSNSKQQSAHRKRYRRRSNHATSTAESRLRRNGRRIDHRADGIAARSAVQDDRQQGAAAQRRERAAELAHDERRLRLDRAIPSSPRSTATTSRTCGSSGRWRSAACRTSARTGPETEVNPLDRQRLHVYQRRLGHDLQDRRAQPEQGRVRLGQRFGRAARGQPAAHARHRAVGGPGDREPARRPRDRAQPRLRARSSGTRRSPPSTNSAPRNGSTPRPSPPRAR